MSYAQAYILLVYEVIKIINRDYLLEEKSNYILKNEYNFFLKKSNVVGVGFGYKRKGGFYTNQKCIQVLVKKKMPKFLIPKNTLIPRFYRNIPTDVIETGELTSCSLTNKIRPVKGGYGISVSNENYFGSAGCLVSNGVSNFVLSTNHVLANENTVSLGTSITQPPSYYGGKSSKDTVATLHKFMPLRFIEGEHQPINLTDCALGLLNKPNILLPDIALIGKLNGIKKSVKLNDEVKKVGCGSELTKGIITTIHATLIITFKSRKRSLFKDLILSSAITQQGDSGSILVNKYNYGIGMIFAFSENTSIACSLNTVFDQLGVHLVT